MNLSDFFKSIEGQLARVSQCKLGSSTLPYRILPSLRPDWGDFYTDFSVSLASRVRQPPEGLAKEALGELSQLEGVNAKVFDGFLNFSLLAPQMLLASELRKLPLEASGEFQILALPLPTKFGKLALSRFSAAICIQLYLLRARGIPASFSSPAVELSAKRCGELPLVDCWRLVSEALSLPSRDPGSYLTSRLRAVAPRSGALWLSPETISSQQLALAFRANPQLDDQLALVSPQRRWLDYEEMKPGNGSLAECLYLASDLAGLDLDSTVPSLNEQANVLWLFRYFQERVNKLVPRLSFEPIPTKSEKDRRFVARAVCLPLWELNAAGFGDVARFVSELHGLACEAMAYLNQPPLRLELQSSSPSDEVRLIAATIWRVSDFLTLTGVLDQ